MNALVTGGAGFIGRWVVKRLLDEGQQVLAFDNLSNGARGNLAEFEGRDNFLGLTVGDIQDRTLLEKLFAEHRFDHCYHLAASIVVQDSIDRPRHCFENDVLGTFNLLECARAQKTRFLFMSTCMVYSRASSAAGIAEDHPLRPASPYAGIKISCENLTLAYHLTYGLPATVIRPFNTYGPFQKTGGEGGVIAVFLQRALAGQPLSIYGEGTQTRDFIYVEDCAEFVCRAGAAPNTVGEVINAGSGRDIAINDLARLIARDRSQIRHVPHIHPQSEIEKLLASSEKARRLLDWHPRFTLEDGIAKTRDWIAARR